MFGKGRNEGKGIPKDEPNVEYNKKDKKLYDEVVLDSWKNNSGTEIYDAAPYVREAAMELVRRCKLLNGVKEQQGYKHETMSMYGLGMYNALELASSLVLHEEPEYLEQHEDYKSDMDKLKEYLLVKLSVKEHELKDGFETDRAKAEVKLLSNVIESIDNYYQYGFFGALNQPTDASADAATDSCLCDSCKDSCDVEEGKRVAECRNYDEDITKHFLCNTCVNEDSCSLRILEKDDKTIKVKMINCDVYESVPDEVVTKEDLENMPDRVDGSDLL